MSELSWSNTDNQFANLTADAEGSDLIVRYNDLTTFLNGNNLDATSNLNASAVFPWTNRHTWIVSDAANNNRSLTVSAIMAITKYGDYITSSAAQVNAALVYRSLTNASSTIPVVHYVNAGTGDTVKSVNSNTGANFLAETTSTGKAYKAKVRSLEDLHAPLMSKVLTTATTVSNSDTETEVEDLTIIVPADFLKVGTTIKGTIYGLMDTPAAATSDISITLKYGTVTLLTTGVINPIKLGGADLYPRDKVQVYTEPVTGDVIKDVGAYLKEKNIPTTTTPKKVDIFKPSAQPTFDILGLQSKAYKGDFGEGGGKVGDEWLPSSAAFGTVTPITPSDVFNVAGGSLALSKIGLTSAASFIFSKPIATATSKGVDYLIPRSDSGFSPSGIPGQVGRGLLFSASLPITGKAFGYEFGKELLDKPQQTTKELYKYASKNPYEIVTLVGAKPTYSLIERQFLKNPVVIKPTRLFEQEVQPYSRQRATLILKNQQGDYIFGKTKSGDVISIGGGIEKGQTPLIAVLAELKQETGLGKSDLLGLKFRKKFVTPEETFYTYTAELKKGSEIKPASDIKKIITLSPSKLAKYSGQTAKYPAYIPIKGTLGLGTKGYLRSYEAGIINFLETGKEPTLLKIDTSLGDFYLGTQSRYNVPGKTQLKYLETDSLLLASGTPKPATLSKLGFKGEFEVLSEASKRGPDKGLYVQPPVSPSITGKAIKLEGYTGKGNVVSTLGDIKKIPVNIPKSQAGYIGLSYTGILEAGPKEWGGIRFGKERPSVLIFKEKPATVSPTAKTFSGAESEFIFDVGSIIETSGRAKRVNIGGNKVFIQEAKRVKDAKKASEISNLLKESTPKSLAKVKKITGIEYSNKRHTYISSDPFKVLSYKSYNNFGKSGGYSPFKSYESKRPFFEENNIIKTKSEYRLPKYKDKILKKEYGRELFKEKNIINEYQNRKPFEEIDPILNKNKNILLPKPFEIGKKSKRVPFLSKQPTRFQTSFTGSVLGIKGKGIAPGGLSIRGII